MTNNPKQTSKNTAGYVMIGGSEMAMTFKLSFFAIIVLTLSSQLSADETLSIHDAIRIVVVTDDEGIHYQSGCAFYELRELLGANEANVSGAFDPTDDPLFEVRAIGRTGNSTFYVGDHWMRTPSGTSLLPTAIYERIVFLVQKRKGQGIKKPKVNASVRQATELIQDPAYVEENRCKDRF